MVFTIWDNEISKLISDVQKRNKILTKNQIRMTLMNCCTSAFIRMDIRLLHALYNTHRQRIYRASVVCLSNNDKRLLRRIKSMRRAVINRRKDANLRRAKTIQHRQDFMDEFGIKPPY